MGTEIVKVTLKDKPEALRGLNPGRLFPEDWHDECGPFPDANLLKKWEAARPKFQGEFGRMLVFGTGGDLSNYIAGCDPYDNKQTTIVKLTRVQRVYDHTMNKIQQLIDKK